MDTNKPQMLLNELHSIGISNVYSTSLSPTDRKTQIKLAKQKLKLVKKNLGQETRAIKSMYDGRNQLQARIQQRELAPFIVLENLIDRLEVALSELETTDSPRKPHHFGEYIIELNGEWRIVDREGLFEKSVNDTQSMIFDTQNVIGTAAFKLKIGFVFKTTCAFIGYMVFLALFLLLLADMIVSNNVSDGIEFNSFPLCGGILVSYLIGGVLFGIKRIPDRAELRQKLSKAQEDIARIEQNLNVLTSDNFHKLEQFQSHIDKIRAFAKKIADFR
ncbi:MAG: hypothetical protein K8L97_22320 [Anaerolineae bacterium]|nr:hypothetical protein [Anaerolineae bacterium]